MVNCAAIDCSNITISNKKKNESISFYKLPKENARRKLWISKLNRENLPKDENIFICHMHFEDHCFERDLRVSSLNLAS